MSSWIVLDRDGVINVDSSDYIKSVEEWHPIPGSIEAIGRLCAAGFNVAIATNQSGIARGLYGIDQMEAIHEKLGGLVEQQGGRISGIFYCPHHPEDNCHCRKPKTGMLDEIEQQFSISLTNVPFVGDSMRDLEAAKTKGCTPVLVRTGNGEKTAQSMVANPDYQSIAVYDDLASYVDELLG